MAADGTTPETGTGAAFTADVKQEVQKLYGYACRTLSNIGGTANAITADSSPVVSALTHGMWFMLVPSADVTGALTLAIDGLPPVDVVDRHGRPIIKGMLKAAGKYPVFFDGVTGDLYAVTCERGMVGRQEKFFSVAAGDIQARTTNGAAAGSLETTTNKVVIKSLDFDASSIEYAQFSFRAAKRWDEGTCTAIFLWSHGSTTINFDVVWALQGLALSNDDAPDTAFGTSISVTDSGGTTDDIYISPETTAITLSNTPNEGDLLVFQAWRFATAGGDTLGVDAKLIGIHLFWDADASEEAA